MNNRVLIIDDADFKNDEVRRIISGRLGFRVEAVMTLEEASRWVQLNKESVYDAIILCSRAVWDEQMAFIKSVNMLRPHLPIIVISGLDSQATISRGAGDIFQVLSKPVSLPVLESALSNSIRTKRMHEYIMWLEHRLAGRCDFSDVIGVSDLLKETAALAKKAAEHEKSVILEGEAGTGKELLARAIHSAGVRASKPFVTVDCRSLDVKNAYAHFFGHEKRDGNGFDYSLGKLYEAEGGTLFLREPQTLPDEVVEALLRVMRTGESPKAGPRLNVRFIFSQRATTEEAHYGQAFASIAPRILVAPLRKRPEDVLPLCEHFLALYSASEQKYIRDISPRAQQWLMHHPWPGNVNQLAHILRRAVILCESNMIELSDLQPSSSPKPIYMEHLVSEGAGGGVLKPLRSIEEEAIRYALQHCGGSMTRAARSLGIGRSTLYRKVSEMNINLEPISRVQTRLRGQ